MATKVWKLRKCSMKTLVFHFCIPNSKHKLGAHWNWPAAAVGRNSPLRPVVKALLHQPESVQFSVQNSELARPPSLPNSWFMALLELEKCSMKQERPKNLKPKKKIQNNNNNSKLTQEKRSEATRLNNDCFSHFHEHKEQKRSDCYRRSCNTGALGRIFSNSHMTEWKNILARLLHMVTKPPPGRTKTTTTSPRSKSPDMDLCIGRKGRSTTTTSLVSGLNEEASSD